MVSCREHTLATRSLPRLPPLIHRPCLPSFWPGHLGDFAADGKLSLLLFTTRRPRLQPTSPPPPTITYGRTLIIDTCAFPGRGTPRGSLPDKHRSRRRPRPHAPFLRFSESRPLLESPFRPIFAVVSNLTVACQPSPLVLDSTRYRASPA